MWWMSGEERWGDARDLTGSAAYGALPVGTAGLLSPAVPQAWHHMGLGLLCYGSGDVCWVERTYCLGLRAWQTAQATQYRYDPICMPAHNLPSVR
jgi:hypothetical protein